MTRNRTYGAGLLAAAVLVLAAGAGSAQMFLGGGASLKSSPRVMAAFRGVVEKPSLSTVRVLCDGKERALGAVVGADGWIVTKSSELSARNKIVVKFKDGRTFDAQLKGVHDKS